MIDVSQVYTIIQRMNRGEKLIDKQTKRGKTMELEQFIKNYQGWLKSYLFSKMPYHWTDQDLEDTVQDTWLKVAEQFNGEDYKPSYKWLKTVAESVLINKIRDESTRNCLAPESWVGDHVPALDEWGEDSLESEPDVFASQDLHENELDLETQVIVKDYMEKLGEVEREIIIDSLEGLTEREIADKNNVSLRKVRKAINPEEEMSMFNHPKRDFSRPAGAGAKAIYFIYDNDSGLVRIVQSLPNPSEILRKTEGDNLIILRRIPGVWPKRLKLVKKKFEEFHCKDDWFWYTEEMETFTLTKDMMR